jgi:hypothetical protein
MNLTDSIMIYMGFIIYGSEWQGLQGIVQVAYGGRGG